MVNTGKFTAKYAENNKFVENSYDYCEICIKINIIMCKGGSHMACNCNPNPEFNELENFINGLEDKKGALIGVLHKAQHIFGYLSDDVIFFISDKLGVPTSKIYGVITFYSYFTVKPRGKYVINVCMGTACFVRGAEAVLREFEKQLNLKAGDTSEDMKFTLSELRCVGACSLAPVVVVNDKVYGKVEKDQVKKILEECK